MTGRSFRALGLRDSAAIIERARAVLQLDRAGRPRVGDPNLVLPAVDALVQLGEAELVDELLVRGFLRGSEERYAEHVAPAMVALDGGRFEMGTPAEEAGHFCGESPRHVVELRPFSIGAVPVTNELFAILDPQRGDVPAGDRRKPATEVSWSHAMLFALWVGGRLPTEAEWELACGAGSAAQWCCDDERDLRRFAWYSENSGGIIHAAGTMEPNAQGVFDMHGNTWEWCADLYEEDWYGRSPAIDPLNHRWPDGNGAAVPLEVCRGGSVHALAEMCRTRYRQSEPMDYWATDIGLRLARSHGGEQPGPGVPGGRS